MAKTIEFFLKLMSKFKYVSSLDIDFERMKNWLNFQITSFNLNANQSKYAAIIINKLDRITSHKCY